LSRKDPANLSLGKFIEGEGPQRREAFQAKTKKKKRHEKKGNRKKGGVENRDGPHILHANKRWKSL